MRTAAASAADGRPIYLRADGAWTPEFTRGHVTTSEAERDAMIKAARADEFTVCDPYEIEVEITSDGPRPASLRESIRAGGGPTIAFAS